MYGLSLVLCPVQSAGGKRLFDGKWVVLDVSTPLLFHDTPLPVGLQGPHVFGSTGLLAKRLFGSRPCMRCPMARVSGCGHAGAQPDGGA